jgi:predicted membrane chloride channel (bestrophin family)
MKHKYTGKLPDAPWTEKRIEDQIYGVMGRIKAMQREVNCIHKEMNALRNRKGIVQGKISDAHLYINQLRKQKDELIKSLNDKP